MILSQFRVVGNDLFTRGLVTSHSGNLSVKMGDHVIITRRGSKLGYLEENDLIETGLTKNDRSTPLASIELPVHRAIYLETHAQAIVHAHPPHAIALSLAEKEIVSSCVECAFTLGNVPVIGWDMEVKPGGLADVIAQALKEHRIILVHGHGSFATGQLLDEALDYTHTLEEACQVICLLRSLKVSTPEE